MKNIFNVLKRDTMSTAVRETLEIEAFNGARIANRLRHALVGLMLFQVLVFSHQVFFYNVLTVFLFWGVTVGHTLILRKEEHKLSEIFNFVVLVLDFLLIFGILIIYTKIEGQNNYSFAVKNAVFWILLFPVTLQLMTLRVRLLLTAVVLMLVFQFTLVALAMQNGPIWTERWFEHFMGDKLIFLDILTFRPIVTIGIGLVMGYSIFRSVSMVRRLGEVEQQKSTLSRYFSPKVVEEITKNPEVLQGGKRQKVTILFLDIRDFTQFSERISADELVQFLSDFRQRMTSIILRNDGSVDKFIGDAIMATFGTPLPSPIDGKDSNNAVKAAREMLSQLKVMNQERSQRYLTPIQIGIGIHTGDVVAGSIGQDELLEYSVIGDVVNTASRIEGLCKTFQAEFLISEEVYREVGAQIDVMPLPPTLVKGKEKPLILYKVIAEEPTLVQA